MPDDPVGELSLHLLEQIDAACEAFERAWAEGHCPRIEDPVGAAPEAARPRLTAELICEELEQRWRRGEPPSLDEYRQRFPLYRDHLAGWIEEARAAAERAATPARKDTDDPGGFPTHAGPSIPSLPSLPLQLLGEYELLERLGRGGMGDVYRARHRRLDRLVALKLLRSDPGHPGELAVRFRREMKAIGVLEHRNIVEALDAGEQSGIVYLAMKLIEGVDLERLVEQCGSLPVAEACELVRQAAVGLHYLHTRGLVHRDVKPSNLMRTREGTVKVLDLGLARWRREAEVGHGLTETGRVMGTPDFLAPEQVRDAATADVRADLYGLGGTLFYLLTGRAPFAHHKSLYAKLDAHRSELPPDAGKLRPEVPAELAALLRRLLAKDPQARPQTAEEVAAALARFAAPGPGPLPPTLATAIPGPGRTDRPSVPVARLRRVLRQHRWLSLLTVVVVSGTLGLLFGNLNNRFLGTPKLPDREVQPADSGKQRPTGTDTPLNRAEPIHVMRLDVNLTRKGQTRPEGMLGEDIFNPRLGDTVTVKAQLTRPAYAYLIAFHADGSFRVCFPEKEDERPPLTDSPRYPSVTPGVQYALDEGTGLAAFAVVISSKPLPAFKEWSLHNQGCPWKKAEAPPGLVYQANGEDEVEVIDVGGSRGPGAEVKGKTPMARLADWLRHAPSIETVQVLGFSVGAKGDE